MDTLQVTHSQLNVITSKGISRPSSPCRSDPPMSRDRELTDSSVAGGGLMRFKTHSPSTTRRRSRDRDRGSSDKAREIDLSDLNMTYDSIDQFDDSRLSDEMGYQSFTSEEVDHNIGGSTIQLVPTDSSVSGGGTKPHPQHHHHSRSNSMQAFDRLNTKIACTKESIRKEQTARDDNVNEYLKLAANADKQQLQRIKAVFEKKNQKSAHTISQLQKKLESYNKRIKDVQFQHNSKYNQMQGHRQPREVLRDVSKGLGKVGGNIKDGITGLSGSVMAKPREFAHLIKNKFGSADNINQLSNPELNGMALASGHIGDTSGGCGIIGGGGSSTPNNAVNSIDAVGSVSGGGGGSAGGGGSGKFNSEHESECSSVTSDSMPGGSDKHQTGADQDINVKMILTELQSRREECDKLKEKLERLEVAQKEVSDIVLALESERYRSERLEEQINDLTELHQNEIENLKQTMADMEEKVQYQSDERLRDINEMLDACQTRISKMEHLSQQQYVPIEGIDNSNARALVVKLINVVLTVLQVVLLLVATAAGIIMPFLKTRVRVLTTLSFIFMTIFVIRQWPDVRDIGSHMVRHLKESLVIK